MLDFVTIATRTPKRGVIEVFPKFKMIKSSDLMIRGGDFYAIWVEELGLWSTDEQDVITLVDNMLDIFRKENASKFDDHVIVQYMWDASTGVIDSWHKYCQKQCRDNFHMLDETIIFSNTPVKKENFASKRLPYSLEEGSIANWDELIGTLYTPEERMKIEWAIGAIVVGDSRFIQKFLVLYGSAGTGKSTILNIIQQLFEGYYSVFDAKALGSSSNSFALEAFKTNPLIAIQHDGDLSHIEDNTRLNSLVSHELMTVNEKFKSTYSNQFKAFLFMGTNKPVKITDAKSGLIRRLIDVSPSGNKVSQSRYKHIMHQIKFELGAIAFHCMNVYLNNKNEFDDYIPISMMGASNDFYNFVEDSYSVFKKEDSVTLTAAWEMYKTYCEDARVPYPASKRIFKEELKNYFKDFKDRIQLDDNTRLRSVYLGFRKDRFEERINDISKPPDEPIGWLNFREINSIFDIFGEDYPAQYATKDEKPSYKWSDVRTILSDLDTRRLHYVKVPENHIVIDFDIPDESGKKCFAKNLEAAKKWPETYAELSKSGQGIHLHYIYNGDVSQLSPIFEEHVEVKVFSGGSSLRRKLTKCNDIALATINSGLPLKGVKPKVINEEAIRSEKGLRNMILRNLRKEIHAGTKPSMDFIKKILDDAYDSGMKYDVSDMRNKIMNFAADSTNHASYCLKLANDLKYKSEEAPQVNEPIDDEIVFYDIEVFPNLLLVNFKTRGKEHPMFRLINPGPRDIELLIKRRLVGFNCRRYDNHILYARLMGYDNEAIYRLSQKIIKGEQGCFFSQAYNISYTDIYDFASAGNKKSLKKLEIEMGIHHQELGLPWDEPVPEELWSKVSEYCDNDVYATEAAFDYLSADWTARQILADLAGMSVNDTTNSLTTKIIFGDNRKPQGEFQYRDLSKPVHYLDPDVKEFLTNACPEMMAVRHGDEDSLLPYFPGYSFEKGVSTYRGETVGEGGYVYAEPGIYTDVALLDVASMHPHSTIAECLFGVKYTTAYRDIVEGRVSIKHEAWDIVNGMLDGKLTPYIQKVIDGEMTSGQLANALKTAINSVYGLTSAKFDNPFRDRRNVDNIVAKRGALFMINLKHEVQARGFKVAHIKTDSIKIPNATPEIIEFVMNYGLKYGYTFEHEATYDRMCLVNDAVYIAKYKGGKHDGEWTATGTQFAVPYVYKTLFTKEELIFDDFCETKNANKGALYLDMNEKLPENEHDYHFIGRVGQFCPVKFGYGSGELVCIRDEKPTAPPGTKGYRWLESETVKNLYDDPMEAIDISYYEELRTKAAQAIMAYGDFENFISNNPYKDYGEEEPIPFA